jgi:hypothetical protein
MGRKRSLSKVAKELGKSDTIITRWSHTHYWVERVNQYDVYLDAISQKEHEASYLKRKAKQKNNVLDMADFGINLAGRVGQRVGKNKNPTVMAVASALNVMNKSADEYRKAYDDQPTSRTEIIDRRLLQQTIDAIKSMGQEPADVFNEMIRMAEEHDTTS